MANNEPITGYEGSTIALLDDDVVVRSVLNSIIRRTFNEVETLPFASIDDLLERVTDKDQVQAAFLDRNVHGVDGWKMASNYLNELGLNYQSMIFFSGDIDPNEKELYEGKGGIILQKPAPVEDVVKLTEQMLQYN